MADQPSHAVVRALLGRTFHFEKRTGPWISFEGGAGASAFAYHERSLTANDPNAKSGECAFTPLDASSGTLAKVGTGISTLMAAFPGYTTPIGNWPLKIKLSGANSIEVDSEPVDGEQRSSVTLTAFSPVPEIMQLIAKTNIATLEEQYGEQLAWVSPKDSDVKTGKPSVFQIRPHPEDFDTGSATKFQWRDKGDVKFSAAIFGGMTAPAGWNSGIVDVNNNTVTFLGGGHSASFQWSKETVEIAPGWGETTMTIVKLVGDGKAVRLMHNGLSKPVIDVYTKQA